MYDALNVLEALDIISFDNKDIRWVGLEESKVVQEVSRQKAAQVLAQRGRLPHNDEGDEESEEPEDDDMEIEKLQVKQTIYFFILLAERNACTSCY